MFVVDMQAATDLAVQHRCWAGCHDPCAFDSEVRSFCRKLSCLNKEDYWTPRDPRNGCWVIAKM